MFPVETDNLRNFKNYDGYVERELYIDFDYENNTIISKSDVSRLRGSILKAFKKYNSFNELFPFTEKYVDNLARVFIILHSSFHIFGGDESFDYFQELTSMDIYNSWFYILSLVEVNLTIHSILLVDAN